MDTVTKQQALAVKHAVIEGRTTVRRTAAVAAVGALLLLAGCTTGDTGGRAAVTTSAAPAAPAQLALTPASGSRDVSPIVPIQVSVTGGDVTSVVVADAAGHQLTGALADAQLRADAASGTTGDASSAPTSSGPSIPSGSPAASSATSPAAQKALVWTPDTPLDYGATYTITATAQNRDRKNVTAAATFTTVSPDQVDTPGVGPLDGMEVGVGMPIRVYFDQPVVNKAEVERHLKVTSSTPTDGVWNWFDDTEVHFRPSTYWPANTDVKLSADLYGIDFGHGVWGEKDKTVSFHVGDKHVSIVDAAAHTMQVYDGDQLIQNFPMSAGSTANPTRNGPHVVAESYRSIVMDSSTFGLAADAPGGYRTNVDYAVRISNNGEFVHSAPWSVGQQGYSNVSHGCINLSPSRALWFFNWAVPGDIVDVKNSVGPTLSAADGDIHDWTIPWDEWKAGSALT
jgi:lipoprotein-anchoring transpeptidase ErfK/SrfK